MAIVMERFACTPVLVVFKLLTYDCMRLDIRIFFFNVCGRISVKNSPYCTCTQAAAGFHAHFQVSTNVFRPVSFLRTSLQQSLDGDITQL